MKGSRTQVAIATPDPRRAVAADAEAKLDDVLSDALAGGFAFDWRAIIAKAAAADDPVKAAQRELERQAAGDMFANTFAAIQVHGQLLALYSVKRHEQVAGLRDDMPPVMFADPETFTPTQALRRWQQVLGLEPSEGELIKDGTRQLWSPDHVVGWDAEELQDRITTELLDELQTIITRNLENGGTADDWVEEAQALMPDRSEAVLRNEYNTTLTDVYTGTLQTQIEERQDTFPFMQFIALKDSRTTWWICRPMGTAGPNKTGYIAATGDDIWLTWRPPCHYSCRSTVSPIGYREAQRMGILAADGRTKIAVKGGNPNRPFGDPPDFAEDPETKELRKVEPQEGFGGNGATAPTTDNVIARPPAPQRTAKRTPAERAAAPANRKKQPTQSEPTLRELMDRLKTAPKELDGQKLLDRDRATKKWDQQKREGNRPVAPPAAWVSTAVIAAMRRLSAAATTERDRMDIRLALLRRELAGTLPGGAFDQAMLGLHANGEVTLIPASGSADFEAGWVVSKYGTLYSHAWLPGAGRLAR